MTAMRRIVVTGASGFIGSRVVAKLAACARLAGTFFTNRTVRVGEVAYVQCDLTRRNAVFRLLDSFQPDGIVHIAGTKDLMMCQRSPSMARLSHMAATENLLAACPSTVHFTYVSTDCVFDGSQESFREDDAPAPINEYGRVKLACETLVQAAAVPWAICRVSLVYGWQYRGQTSNTVMDVIRAAVRGWPLRFPCTLYNTPVFVEDVAACLSHIALARATGTFHIAGPERLSRYQLSREAAAAFGITDAIRPAHDHSGIRPANACLDASASADRLKYRFRTLREGLELMRAELLDPSVSAAVGASIFNDQPRAL